jgi:hypothetical protein
MPQDRGILPYLAAGKFLQARVEQPKDRMARREFTIKILILLFYRRRNESLLAKKRVYAL